MQRGSICVISSHVARGSVGNRAAVFALEALGLSVVAVPTVVLPWHPGHGHPTRRMALPDAGFAQLMDDLSAGPFAGEITAVLSGYFASEGQVAAVASAVSALKQRRPDLVYLCDPVIGDDSGLYVPEPVARAISTLLVPLADIITPNRFELSWLSGMPVADTTALVAAARSLGTGHVLVTSAPAMMRDGIANMLVTADQAVLAEHRRLAKVPHGTGDLTAALFLGHLAGGATPADALQRTTASVHDLLMRTARRGADELTLSADADALTRPASSISLRRLVTTPLDKRT